MFVTCVFDTNMDRGQFREGRAAVANAMNHFIRFIVTTCVSGSGLPSTV